MPKWVVVASLLIKIKIQLLHPNKSPLPFWTQLPTGKIYIELDSNSPALSLAQVLWLDKGPVYVRLGTEVGGHHEAAVAQMAGQVGPHLVQISVPDGGLCPRPQQLVGVHQGRARRSLLGNSEIHRIVFIFLFLFSVADPRCLSRIRIFFIPGPRNKEFKYFNPKNCF